MAWRGLVLLFCLSCSLLANAGASHFPFQGLDATLHAWGLPLQEGLTRSPSRPIRIAVLDKTFFGYEKELGKTLPRKTRHFEGPVEIPGIDPSAHGLRMAQLLSYLATQKMRHPNRIELRLYRVAGFSNFKAAIDAVIDWKADLVLHSEVWEVGGNSDGKGFINQQVSRATKAGILWINAAGNFEGQAYQGPIETDEDDNVLLLNKKQRLTLICKAPKGRKCPLRAVLTWNSFHDDPEEGTDEDLNFDLRDAKGKLRGESRLKQVRAQGEAPAGSSKYPRESFNTELEPGRYEFRIQAASSSFTARSALRLSVNGEHLELPDQTPGETLLNPADHPDVLTVGAFDSDRSSLSRHLGKPELFAPSSVTFEDGQEYRGSSNSAAFVAGLIALKLMKTPGLGKRELLQSSLRFSWRQGSRLRTGMPGARACFQIFGAEKAPAWLRPVISLGGQFVQTSEGAKIMMPFDPLALQPLLQRSMDVDRVIWTPYGWTVQSRFAPVPSNSIEVFQRPADAGPCKAPALTQGRLLIWN